MAVAGIFLPTRAGTVTGFTMQRATNNGFTQNATSFSLGGSARSYVDAGTLNPRVTYYYRINASNAVGTSGWSTISVLVP